jgi:PAS domain S-box-containing protein
MTTRRKEGSTLRRRAEARYAGRPRDAIVFEKDPDSLIHELRVHQIELEIQNEELRGAQASLEESRRRFVDLYEFAPVGYCSLDGAGIVLRINLTGTSLLNYSRSYVLGKPLAAFVHGEDKDAFFLFLRGLRESAGERRCEVRLKRKGGQVFSAELISVPLTAASTEPGARFLVAVIDVSARKQAQEELSEQRDRSRRDSEFLNSVLNGIRDGFLVLDAGGRISYMNHNAEVLLKRGKNDVLGKRLEIAFPESKSVRLEEGDRRSLHEGKVVIFEFNFPAEPYRNWYEVRLYPFAEGICVFFAVITERKRMQEALEEHARRLDFANRELETFSYSVSHDLRAPLTLITGFSRLLLEDYSGAIDATGRDYIARIVDAVDKMQRLIDAILSLSRVSRQKLELEEVDLGAIAAEALRDLHAAQPGRNVESIIADNLKAIGDSELLRVALTNLLGNAWKYTGKTDNPRIEFGSVQKKGKTVFFVKDNGAGFDQKYAEHLFKPFQRLHAESEFPGTGVGLATVARIISRHGGGLWAEAEKGKGATFYFTLGTDTDGPRKGR